MAIHKRREESGRVAARLLLESTEPVELPPAEIDDQDATVEREEFRQYLPELLDALEEGGWVDPAPMVQSDSIFVIEGETRSFWVRLWHTDESRTRIARLHVLSCLPHTPAFKINFGDNLP
ncbi:MAG TPA: hypothetical protein VJ810_25405 [Blastocatellia bacterium]|nr:hypothetical protein [Blastocatellia bacterium]